MRIIILGIEGWTAPAVAMAVGLSRRICQRWAAPGIDGPVAERTRQQPLPPSAGERPLHGARRWPATMKTTASSHVRLPHINKKVAPRGRSSRGASSEPSGSPSSGLWDTNVRELSERRLRNRLLTATIIHHR